MAEMHPKRAYFTSGNHRLESVGLDALRKGTGTRVRNFRWQCR